MTDVEDGWSARREAGSRLLRQRPSNVQPFALAAGERVPQAIGKMAISTFSSAASTIASSYRRPRAKAARDKRVRPSSTAWRAVILSPVSACCSTRASLCADRAASERPDRRTVPVSTPLLRLADARYERHQARLAGTFGPMMPRNSPVSTVRGNLLQYVHPPADMKTPRAESVMRGPPLSSINAKGRSPTSAVITPIGRDLGREWRTRDSMPRGS